MTVVTDQPDFDDNDLGHPQRAGNTDTSRHQPDFDDNDLGQLEDTVTRIIREVLFIEVPAPETDLIDAGLLDSLGLVSLITELEVELGFELPLEELDVDGFRTVHGIAAFVTTALAKQRSVG